MAFSCAALSAFDRAGAGRHPGDLQVCDQLGERVEVDAPGDCAGVVEVPGERVA
jgi:hypothetical protein